MLDGNTWKVDLEQADVVIGQYTLHSDQWPVESYTPPRPGGFAFSPDCTKFVLTLSGWIYTEGDGQEELWMLDIPKQSLSRSLIGDWTAFRLWDYPVEQVTPSWAPDGMELVFGDSHFGLEIYSPETKRRQRLAAPAFSGSQPLWSPSGQWIASRRNESPDSSIRIISRDGAAYSSTGNCYFVEEMSWAPAVDSLAYLCQETIGGRISLWQWSIPQKP
jgi:Tol biopolymer transport system component